MSTISSTRGQGIASLMQASGSSSASGLLNAISGGGTSSTTATNLFNAITPGSSTSIDGLLQQQKITQKKNAIYANVAQRLDAMQAGTYTAKDDWEKVASYAMQTGQPVAISLNSKGQIEALTQSQADLSKYNVQQQNRIYSAINDVTTMAGKIQANQTNDTLINKLAGAEYDLSMVATGQVDAQSNWEQEGLTLMTSHRPFKISLDAQGNLQVKDQLFEQRDDLTSQQQKLLHEAVASIPNAIATAVTTTWQAEALTFDQNAVPYYIDIDPVTNEISAKESTADNITPSFLKETPYPDIGANTPYLKQAADLIKNKKAFFLDFDQGGHMVAHQATAQNLIKYNTSTQSSTSSQYGTGSILSLFA